MISCAQSTPIRSNQRSRSSHWRAGALAILFASMAFAACSDAQSSTATVTAPSETGTTSTADSANTSAAPMPTLGNTPVGNTSPGTSANGNTTGHTSAAGPPAQPPSVPSGNDTQSQPPPPPGVPSVPGDQSGAGGAPPAVTPPPMPSSEPTSSDVTATPSDAGTSDEQQTEGFDPCPNDEPCKILPLGDSITEGIGQDLGMGGGYRAPLFGLAVGADKDITFIGRRTGQGPDAVNGATFPRNHEGYSGHTIDMLMGEMDGWPFDGEPHIILLHIGTNDIVRQPDGITERLGTLLDRLLEGNPQALLVVSTIIPLSFGSVDSYNQAIPGVVQSRVEAGAHLILVDQFTGFPTSELGDGVHPNEAGYSRMAGVWFEAIEPYLKP